MLEELKPHLIDLRKRLIISVSCLIVMFFICFNFNEYILSWMLEPLIKVLPNNVKPVFLQVGEGFITAVKVSFFAGFVISSPIIFWQIWLFIAPGLYSNEKKLILPFVFFGTLMFVTGAAFAYYIVFPFGLDYLINFGDSKQFSAMPSIGYYAGFFAKTMIGFGISFELPVISYFLAKLGLITDQTLIKFFRIAIVLIFILAAFLTPPDVSTQFLMAIPLIILYGVSIIIVKFVNPEKDLV
ncbi:twin-arginine translocase subunit TatC [Helicobacter sp. MIT 14-3879]|uniref:twin-arginine translocase subunit TatC n=1 Tax=Helicobacter sp. MIT 14-3879 TaxID=2040649 RepID=UPI000E1F665D|nr:twin-arginine translocase subunit TatC [Helicobacter sp. MIT 14-3879]RDU62870.1 twin-arginine translocase subunit TatC [Helicobacter sp. MIT 14-3879]